VGSEKFRDVSVEMSSPSSSLQNIEMSTPTIFEKRKRSNMWTLKVTPCHSYAGTLRGGDSFNTFASRH
jgi:hypothetical protein